MAEKQNIPEIRFEGFTDPWEQRKLGEVVTIVGGGTPSTNNDAYWDGDIDWYSPAELGGQIYADRSVRRITQAGYDSCSATLLPAGKTILFTSRAGIGNTAILRRSACTNQGFQSLVVNDDTDVYFVYSMTDRIKKFAEQKASGSTFLEISGKGLADGEFAFPSKDEQAAIGSMFKQFDSLITLHQRKCQYRSLCGYLSWEQRKFGELYRPVSEKNDLSFGRDRIISVANMYFNSAVYVTEDSYLATYNVMRLGDIAFEGNRSKRFAHGRFVENTIGDGIVSHVFKVFRPVGNNYDLAYWKHAINNEKLMKDALTRSTKASTMMHELVSSDFLEESTLVPTLDEQRAIGIAIDSIDNLITLHQRKLNLLKNTKKSLLDKMFV